MRRLSFVLIPVALASCAPAPELQRTDRAEAHLQSLIAGRTAGQPRSCLPHYRAENMVIIDDHTVFYSVGSQLYRQDFRGGRCNGLGSGHYALVTKQFSGTLCSGDIAHVMDTGSGAAVGTCIVGDFVPYSRVR